MSIKVEVFSSPGCSKCGRARENLKKVAEDIGGGRIQWREVNVLEEMAYAISLGVHSTPAIAIEGEMVFTGLPTARRLRAELLARLGGTGGGKES